MTVAELKAFLIWSTAVNQGVLFTGITVYKIGIILLNVAPLVALLILS